MSLLPIQPKPGLYTETTDRGALDRWKLGNNVRFFKGNPEKIGGRSKLLTDSILGVCRSIVAWTTLTFARYAALGTSVKLYLTDTIGFYDITPLRSSGTLGLDPLTTTAASATIEVHHVGHGLAEGDYFHLSGATAVGGVTPDGQNVVTVVVDTDNYRFDWTAVASSSATGGGAAVLYEYEIPVGTTDSILGAGWGTGGFGIGTWGVSGAPVALQDARIWALAPWGEDLLASPQNCPIYVWSATLGSSVRATLVAAAPATNRWILVTNRLRIVVSYGSHDGTDSDPMLIRWCDSEDYTEWTPDITNLAGDLRLSLGTKIIRALPTRGEIAIFTDTTVYAQTLTGDDNVFRFDDKGQTSGLMGPNAVCDANGVIYAMGRSKFYTYDGQVIDLPCDVYSQVFGTPEAPAINLVQSAKVFSTWNTRKSEIMFFFCGYGSDEINRVVGVSTGAGPNGERAWWLGDVASTAWLDNHPFDDTLTTPLGAVIGPDGLTYLYAQESGFDDEGVAIPYFLESYDMEIGATNNLITGTASGAGEFIYTISKIIPDIVRIVGTHLVTLKGRKNPQDRQWSRGPKKLTSAKRHIDMRLRSRQIAIRIESAELGSDISLGTWRMDTDQQGEA